MAENEFKCTVSFWWDEESAVWIATSEDIAGLVLEDESFDRLSKRVEKAIPELLVLNHRPTGIIRYLFKAEKSGKEVVYG